MSVAWESDLGRHVGKGARAVSALGVSAFEPGAYSKVGQSNVALSVDENVVGLDIAVEDEVVVTVFEGEGQ